MDLPYLIKVYLLTVIVKTKLKLDADTHGCRFNMTTKVNTSVNWSQACIWKPLLKLIPSLIPLCNTIQNLSTFGTFIDNDYVDNGDKCCLTGIDSNTHWALYVKNLCLSYPMMYHGHHSWIYPILTSEDWFQCNILMKLAWEEHRNPTRPLAYPIAKPHCRSLDEKLPLSWYDHCGDTNKNHILHGINKHEYIEHNPFKCMLFSWLFFNFILNQVW